MRERYFLMNSQGLITAILLAMLPLGLSIFTNAQHVYRATHFRNAQVNFSLHHSLCDAANILRPQIWTMTREVAINRFVTPKNLSRFAFSGAINAGLNSNLTRPGFCFLNGADVHVCRGVFCTKNNNRPEGFIHDPSLIIGGQFLLNNRQQSFPFCLNSCLKKTELMGELPFFFQDTADGCSRVILDALPFQKAGNCKVNISASMDFAFTIAWWRSVRGGYSTISRNSDFIRRPDGYDRSAVLRRGQVSRRSGQAQDKQDKDDQPQKLHIKILGSGEVRHLCVDDKGYVLQRCPRH